MNELEKMDVELALLLEKTLDWILDGEPTFDQLKECSFKLQEIRATFQVYLDKATNKRAIIYWSSALAKTELGLDIVNTKIKGWNPDKK